MPRKNTAMMSRAAEAAPLEEDTAAGSDGDPELDQVVIAIQLKAYELFLSRGERHGDDLADWLEAERIVRSQLS
jgi:hypothetical protein